MTDDSTPDPLTDSIIPASSSSTMRIRREQREASKRSREGTRLFILRPSDPAAPLIFHHRSKLDMVIEILPKLLVSTRMTHAGKQSYTTYMHTHPSFPLPLRPAAPRRRDEKMTGIASSKIFT
jgi:hypothetical protein